MDLVSPYKLLRKVRTYSRKLDQGHNELWTEEPGGLQSMGWQESDTTKRLNHQQSSLKVQQEAMLVE